MNVKKTKPFVARVPVIHIEMVRHSAFVMVRDIMAAFVRMILMSAHCPIHHVIAYGYMC